MGDGDRRIGSLQSHCFSCFRVNPGDIVIVGQCRPLSKIVRFNVLRIEPQKSCWKLEEKMYHVLFIFLLEFFFAWFSLFFFLMNSIFKRWMTSSISFKVIEASDMSPSLAHLLNMQKVSGSNPVIPIFILNYF